MRSRGKFMKDVIWCALALVSCFAVIERPTTANSQSISTPLSFQECLNRKKELNDQARETGDKAWEIVKNLPGLQFTSAASNALYEKSDEIRKTSDAFKCVFQPDTPTSKNGDKLGNISEALGILRKEAIEGRSTPKELLLGRLDSLKGLASETALGTLGLPNTRDVTISTSTTISEMINDRLKEIDDHNQALLGLFDKLAEQIKKSGKAGDLPESPNASSTLSQSYLKMFEDDYFAAEAEKQAKSESLKNDQASGTQSAPTVPVISDASPPKSQQTSPYVRRDGTASDVDIKACEKFPDHLARVVCIAKCSFQKYSDQCRYIITKILPDRLSRLHQRARNGSCCSGPIILNCTGQPDLTGLPPGNYKCDNL